MTLAMWRCTASAEIKLNTAQCNCQDCTTQVNTKQNKTRSQITYVYAVCNLTNCFQSAKVIKFTTFSLFSSTRPPSINSNVCHSTKCMLESEKENTHTHTQIHKRARIKTWKHTCFRAWRWTRIRKDSTGHTLVLLCRTLPSPFFLPIFPLSMLCN